MDREYSEISEFIQDNDVKLVKFSFADVFGRQRLICVLPSLLPKAVEEGVAADAAQVPGFDRSGDSERFLYPDTSTIARLPWRPSHGRAARFSCGVRDEAGSELPQDSPLSSHHIGDPGQRRSWRNWAMDKLHEECAVVGVSLKDATEDSDSPGEAAGICYNALLSMQHRGQEGAGIAVCEGSSIRCVKNVGLLSEVFGAGALHSLPKSRLAIGHVRYSTTGSNTVSNAQPFVMEYLTGRLAAAHNGNVVNAREIKEKLRTFGLDFSATSDTEVISSLIAYMTLRQGDLLLGVKEAARLLKGAFSLVVLGADGSLIALRDGNGYRPLCLGESDAGVIAASETCALDSCGYRFLRDVQPGEIVQIRDGKIRHSEIFLQAERKSLCVFEYVYFARPDSVIDGLSVYEARLNMGRELAREHPVEADLICGVPDSGLEAAMGYALESGVPLGEGFVKNRYIGRSFIFPTQKQRENAVDVKLNPLRTAVEGKRVVLVDDSIVRGTTSASIVAAMRRAGAKEVHVRVSAPPFRHTCYFGTDIDSEENLIANKLTIEDIGKRIGADSLGYISVEGLLRACKGSNLELCMGCFTGEYATRVAAYSKNLME
jgi:amidophosphoribosyltransferase